MLKKDCEGMCTRMGSDAEANQFDVGTTSIRLVRVGKVIQIIFSSPPEARFLYKELAERYKQAERRLRVD